MYDDMKLHRIQQTFNKLRSVTDSGGNYEETAHRENCVWAGNFDNFCFVMWQCLLLFPVCTNKFECTVNGKVW